MKDWDVKQIRSSPYHPQSQGAIERFHGTMKSLLRIYCAEQGAQWDEAIAPIMFAIRDSVVESLGMTPFQLVYGHTVRSPIVMLKDRLTSEGSRDNLETYVQKFKCRLFRARKLAKENLKISQATMAKYYNKGTKKRSFNAGDKVLVYLPVKGTVNDSKFCGPYMVKKKLGDLTYVIHMPDRENPRYVT